MRKEKEILNKGSVVTDELEETKRDIRKIETTL
jgi:hypothetical protein